MHTGPESEGRTCEHDRARQIWMYGRHHHDLPARLAVCYDDRFAFGLGMQLHNLLDESCLGATNVLDSLSRHGFRKKSYEVTGVAGRQSDSDFAVVLHASDAGPVPGPGVNNDKRWLGQIYTCSDRWNYPYQRIIDRPRKFPAVANQFSLEIKDIRNRTLIVGPVVVGTLAQ